MVCRPYAGDSKIHELAINPVIYAELSLAHHNWLRTSGRVVSDPR